MSNGKGSRARPLAVDTDTFARNWERTFNLDAIAPGSSYATDARLVEPNATIAQLEERRSANAEVGGSSPLGRSPRHYTLIAELGQYLFDG